jgi:mono/diheme cytochrome c family protein
MTYDELEETTGVPAELLERAGAARAAADGKTEEQVVADWTGDESAAAAPSAPVTTPEPAATTAPAQGLPSADSLTGEALLAAAAEAKGIPLSLVERSAQARADADGVPVEQVMRQWVIEAGMASAGAASPEPVAPAAPEAPVAESAPAPSPEPAPAEVAELDVEVLEPAVPAAEAPFEVDEQKAAGRYPAWLAASLVIIPLIAALYVMVVPDQPSCGSAGQVAVDPATGLHANCDGSAYGAQGDSNLAAGGDIFTASCAACHGAAGEGGVGPAMAGGAVLETFPAGSCSTHIEWVTLGSNGWPDPTYGAQNKPVGASGAIMPPWGSTLSEEEIAQVVLYERVALGGEDQATAATDCGLGDATAAASG